MGSIPEPTFVLGGVKIDMGCMNLVTVISRYTRVPVTLKGTHAVGLQVYNLHTSLVLEIHMLNPNIYWDIPT